MIIKVKEGFWRFTRFKIGLGEEIRFWDDLWVGKCTHKKAFRSFYLLAINKFSYVADNFD